MNRSLPLRILRRRPALLLLSTLAATFLLGCAILTLQVYFQLDELTAAQSDNMDYTIAQLEVDHVKLNSASRQLAQQDADSVSRFRRLFDALYNRTNTLLSSSLYAEALTESAMRPDLQTVNAGLDAMIPQVDGGDAALIAAAPQISEQLLRLADPVRRISLAAVGVDAARSESERGALAMTLLRLAGISLMLLTALIALLWQLWTLYTRFQRRAYENRLTLRRLSTILNTSLDYILVVDPADRILEANSAAEEALGLTKTEGGRKTVTDVLLARNAAGTPEPVTGARLIKDCRNGPNRSMTMMARRSDGTVFAAELSASLASQAGQEVCICYLRDISQRLRAQEQIESARDRALAGEQAQARFLGMISHEMRTPLNGILGTVDLLDETPLTTEQSRFARIIQSAGQQLLTQINDALDLTQAGTGRLSLNRAPFDFDALLEEAVNGLAPQADAMGTRLQVDLPEGALGLVEGDRARVLQVLVNLVSNAVKFTDHGTVTIEAVRPDPAARWIEVQIADTGRGIPQEDLPNIFEDFVRAGNIDASAVPGSGLGLGIVRNLVRAMDGQVTADSIEGEGSLFCVRLPLPACPLAQDARTAATDRVHAPSPNTAPLRILVVDDNEANRFVVSQMLIKDGHDTREAPDGESALTLARQTVFDLVLMDIRMPGIDGVETARRLRALPCGSAAARLVFLTAHIQNDEQDRFAGLKAEAVLAKPLRRSVLRDMLAGRLKEIAPPKKTDDPVDAQVIRQLQESLPAASFASLLSRFRAEGDALHAALAELDALPDSELAERLHAFAGSAATFGATRLQAHISKIETALNVHDPSKARRLLRDIPQIWHDTSDQLPGTQDAA